MEDSKKDISLYIHSPGGYVTAGMAIYDTMQFMTCDVATYCIGMAASMGAVLLAAGTKGKRFSLPNSRIMIHQPSGGARGQASDISIQAKEILRLKKQPQRDHGLSHRPAGRDRIDRDMERDNYMSADEAKEYGIVDEVVKSRREARRPWPRERRNRSNFHGPPRQSDDVLLLREEPRRGAQAHRRARAFTSATAASRSAKTSSTRKRRRNPAAPPPR